MPDSKAYTNRKQQVLAYMSGCERNRDTGRDVAVAQQVQPAYVCLAKILKAAKVHGIFSTYMLLPGEPGKYQTCTRTCKHVVVFKVYACVCGYVDSQVCMYKGSRQCRGQVTSEQQHTRTVHSETGSSQCQIKIAHLQVRGAQALGAACWGIVHDHDDIIQLQFGTLVVP